MGIKKDYKALKKLHESTNKAVVYLETENKTLKTSIQLLLAEKEQHIKAKQVQQQTIYKQITYSNAENNKNLEEIQRLREEVKRLKDER